MKRGKTICNQLKAIRRSVAEANGIPLEIKECTHQGDCRGTCPRCEAEVRYIEHELLRRKSLGATAIVTGVAMTLSLSSCRSGETQDPVYSDDVLYEGEPIVHCDSNENTPPDSPAVRDEEPDDVIVTGWEGDFFDFEEYEKAQKLALSDTTHIFSHNEVDCAPQFPGGDEQYYAYIAQHLRYPEGTCATGNVYISCVVEPDGSISSATILRDIGGGCGQEAKRLIMNMPRFNPATKNGHHVRCEITLPVRFEIY